MSNNKKDYLTHEEMIQASHLECRELGLDPYATNTLSCYLSDEELQHYRAKYKETIEVIHAFVHKFLSSMPSNEVMINMTDHQGRVLDLTGDPEIIANVRKAGIKEGVVFNEEAGTSSIRLCLQHERPIYLIGEDHYHYMMHQQACCSAPLYDERGQLQGTLSLMTSAAFAHPSLLALLCTMADSVQRELLLRRQNAQLQLMNHFLLDTNYYGVVITDLSGDIQELNELLLKMLGMETNTAAYLNTSVFDMSLIGDSFRKVIQQQEECKAVQLELQHPEGMRYYMLDVVPIYNGDRSLIRYMGNLRDFTEMRSTHEVLRNTEKLVFAGQVAVSIAHEVRNPLTTVKGLLQLSSKDAKLRHYDLIMSEIERMNLIVGEFLILGKPQAALFKQEQCEAILQEVLSIFEIQAALNHVQIKTEYRNSRSVECDRNQIKQVFLNILKNAMEALPFGGEITLLLDVEQDFQKISITDNGIGMSDHVLERIGEPFLTTKPDGNGLGMMIVKKILEAHRGSISIVSEPERGTKVDIYLPVVETSLS